MSNDRSKTPVMRPFLSTQEFLQASRISMQTLRSYENAGICAPVTKSDNGYYKYYSLGQCQIVELAEIMRHSGVSIPDISKVYERGARALLEETLAQCASDIRSTRRRLKSIVNLQRRVDDYFSVDDVEGFYLRYLPQRWMALLPLPGSRAGMPPDESFLKALRRLRAVSEIVGWCSTLSCGAVVSTQHAPSSASSFVFIELASPPMPAVSGSHIVDGGCYRGIDPQHSCTPCEGGECAHCSRFGRQPEASEKAEWEREALVNPDQWAHTVMANSLSEPYATGTWRSYTQGLIDPSREGHPPDELGDADRPRLMPHQVLLPYGVTACEMPAGVYLCRRCNTTERSDAFDAMTDALQRLECDALPDTPKLSDVPEYSRQRKHGARFGSDVRRKPGPFVDPFVSSRSKGDPDLAGWWKEATDEVLAYTRLVTNAALSDGEDVCLVLASTPSLPNRSEVIDELQVLVRYEEMLPPPRRKAGKSTQAPDVRASEEDGS